MINRVHLPAIFCLCIVLCMLCACNGKKLNTTDETGDTLSLRHARNLCIIEYKNRTEVCIRNPWDTTRVLHHYVLSETETKVADGKTLVRVPLRKAGVFTSVHCALLNELGCTDAIAGICELEYIHLPCIQEAVREGRITDLGSGLEPNVERIMDLQPDALMPTPFENSGGYGRLERMGIPLIECADYMEISALACAEWMRFYGRLFGKGREADSLFFCVEENYKKMKRLVEDVEHRPKLISERPSSGHWYMPCGGSTLGELFHDAGADYLFSDMEGTGSAPLSMEHVLDRALEADVWLVKHHGKLTRQDICKDHPMLHKIPARIWLCDTSESLYYEEASFHPEWLLANLIQILHPEVGIPSEKNYFCLLEE